MSGIADTIGSFLQSMGDTKTANNEQQWREHKLQVDNYWKESARSEKALDFGIKFDQMEQSHQKNIIQGYDTAIDNIQAMIGGYKSDLSKLGNEDGKTKTWIENKIYELEQRESNMQGDMERMLPHEKLNLIARNKGINVDELDQEADSNFGRDLDDAEVKEGMRPNSRQGGQQGGNGQMTRRNSQHNRSGSGQTGGNYSSSNASNANGVPSSNDNSQSTVISGQDEQGHPLHTRYNPDGSVSERRLGPMRQVEEPGLNIPGATGATNRQMLPRADGMDELVALQNQVSELISQVQNKSNGNSNNQPLNIPGGQITQEPNMNAQQPQPQSSPQQSSRPFASRTAGMIAQDKYNDDQTIAYEQETHDRRVAQLTAMQKELDTKNISAEDEKIAIEKRILENQNLKKWIDNMAEAGRSRSKSPTDWLMTGAQKMYRHYAPDEWTDHWEKPTRVETAFGKEYSTDTTELEEEIARDIERLPKINALVQYVTSGGKLPSANETKIRTGLTESQNVKIPRNSSLLQGAFQ